MGWFSRVSNKRLWGVLRGVEFLKFFIGVLCKGVVVYVLYGVATVGTL